MTRARTLGVQLYSARLFPPVAEQLAAVQQAGLTAVEPFAPFYEDAAHSRQLFDHYGLSAKSGHFSLEMAERRPEQVVDVARTLGLEIVVIPYLLPQDRPTDAAGWVALGQRLNAIAQGLGREGFRVAWHNHDFEFAPLPDGSLPIEHVLGRDLLWEADLAWVVRGGGDPAHWVQHYSGRVPLVHVKDIAPAGEKADEDGWADVGTGVLPWGELWPLCVAAGAEVMVAEHDKPASFERFVRASAAAMREFDKGTVR